MRKIYNNFEEFGFILGFLILLLAFGLFCLSSALAMVIWNWVGVTVLSLPAVGFWDVFWIKVLLLFLIPSGSSSSKS